MKRALAPLMILALVAAVWAEVPATKPTTRPDPEKHIASNPAVEAIIESVPANLLPPTDGIKDDMPTRIKRLREWGKNNVDGKPVKVTAYIKGDQTARFYTEGKPDRRIEVTPIPARNAFAGFNQGDKVVIEGRFGKGGLLVTKDKGPIRFYFTVVDFKVTKAPD